MKLFLDFFPGLIFLGALFSYDIYVATAAIMLAMTLQIILLAIFKKKISGVQWMTLAVVLGFGTATLLLHDPDFIKWKPTIINWVFSLVLISGPLFFKRNFIKTLMGDQLVLPDHAWSKLNVAWAFFLLVIGFLNLWVAQNFSEKTWGLFKVFGILGLMLVFVLVQGVYLSRFIQDEKEEA